MRDPNLLRANEAFGYRTARVPRPMATEAELLELDAWASARLAKDGLRPSSAGKHVKRSRYRVSWTDGPFTESKELPP
jgi:hypothetical protein